MTSTQTAPTTINRADRVRIPQDAPAQFAGRLGIVLGFKKSGTVAKVLLDAKDLSEYQKHDGVEAEVVNAPIARLERIGGPQPNTGKYAMSFKYEHGNFGPVMLRNTTKEIPDFLEFGKPLPEGLMNFGWLNRSEAKVLAKYYGATYEEF